MHILKSLIVWSCDKAYAWIAVSITTLELSQGWSLVQEAGYPQRQAVKQDCGNHSFISYGEAASLFPFQTEKSFIGTYSPKQQDKTYSFCIQILVNIKSRLKVILSSLEGCLKKDDFKWWIFITFQIFTFQCSSGPESLLHMLTKLLSWGKCYQ